MAVKIFEFNKSVLAVALGATVIEKHMMLNATDDGPDSDFSLCPEEFADMVGHVREAEQALSGPGEKTEKPRQFMKSVYCIKDVRKGEIFTHENVRVIRPGYGLCPSAYSRVLGTTARLEVKRGEPLYNGMYIEDLTKIVT